MENELSFSLDGTEFVTTFFDPNEIAVMYLVLGENLDGEKEGMKFIFLYKCIDGEVEYGIESFVFGRNESIDEFIERLPKMSAVEFLTAGIGARPRIYERIEEEEN